MDDSDNLYRLYLKGFALVRCGAPFEPKILVGEPEDGAWKNYDAREMAAIALGVAEGRSSTSTVPDNKDVVVDNIRTMVPDAAD
ncbi:hypothetical protein D7V80_11770 [Corallococcus sp. CA054B]|uniref:hypothetical protein n=1 Tax=Corallococcus sp. CA054B TaxID=2316734 RepID=UPI000EA170D9|nr:hypothetical protein [Corallococcus sp. CA054B]RKG68668.1 hypothetical protein D7V80_11770 [Corallococcus sp. CA054B]